MQDVSRIIQCHTNSDYPYIHPQYAVTKKSVTKVLLTPENIPDTEAFALSEFFDTIGVDFTELDNFGFARFDNDVPKGNSPCYFGLRPVNPDSDQLEMGLMIGSDDENFGVSAAFVKAEVELKEFKQGKKTFTRPVYTLNDTPIDLVESRDQEGKPLGKFTLSVKNEMNNETYSFYFLIDKSKEFTPDDIRNSWTNGTFDQILRKFGTGGNGKCWAEMNKAFTSHFVKTAKGNTWINPELKDGVYFLVCNGSIKITEAGSHPNITSDIVKSNWEVMATSHPELPIRVKNNQTKVFDEVLLGDVTDINFSTAKNFNQGWSFLISNGYTEFGGIALIRIVEPNYGNLEHIPVNTVTVLEQRIKANLQKYPHMLTIYNSYLGEPEETPQRPMLQAATIDNGAIDSIHPPDSWRQVENVPATKKELVTVGSTNGSRPLTPEEETELDNFG